MSHQYKRRKKLVKPGLQLRMSGVFVGIVTLMLGLQFALLTAELHRAANLMPVDGPVLLERANGITMKLIAVSGAVFLPLTLLVGILSTFRVAGPLYRFQRFLEAVRDGQRPPDFRLRKKDELHDIAALLNEATRPMRMPLSEDAPAARDGDSAASGEASGAAKSTKKAEKDLRAA